MTRLSEQSPGGITLGLAAQQAENGPASSSHAEDSSQGAPSTSTSAPETSLRVGQALDKYRTGVLDLQVLLQSLLDAVEKEREELQQERAQLTEERKAFAEESSRVQRLLNDSEQVILNVGGTRFSTTVTTLRNAPCPSLFNAMFSGRHQLKTDDSGCYFIDRYLLELRAEAEFYGLSGLVMQIDRFPYSLTRVRRAVTVNTEDSWMYEDGQDEVVLTVDQPCQLLGVGLCGTEGSFTVDLEVYEVNPDEFSEAIATLHSVSHSFCKEDGQLVRLMLNNAVPLMPKKHYMLSALVKGTESFCCEECVESVTVGGVKITFHSYESPNGTNEIRGQFPEIYIRTGVSVHA